MRNLSRLLALAVCTTAMGSLIATSEAGTSSRHTKKHHARMSHQYRTTYGFNDVGAAGPVAPVATPSGRRTVCPGMGRSFDCAIWPPPYDEDPDRKVSGSDGG
jgi:hypothetical protein